HESSNINYHLFLCLGLKTVKECKASSDTACGVLEGNYCIDPYEGGCRAAQKHTTCKPGHFIKHPGLMYGQCCPMCPPGTRVYRQCTEFTSTSCVPCIGSTFTNKPNGLSYCFPCTVCDQGLLVKTVKECTASSDTVCGVLEGNYCIDPYGGGCRAAQKHTTCKPGHFIRQPGTDSADTVCENCPENSYSNGSSTSCTPHTNCESKGLSPVKPGNSVSDSQCGQNGGPVIAWIVVGIIFVTCKLQELIRPTSSCTVQVLGGRSSAC
uniref:TNFR-Cys domain-containing protein n=1 Tax=Scleropages formosus TaxID=113540 RepID=A0A8C9QWT3_SCLFO